MPDDFYGWCDTCGEKVQRRYHSFSRQIERIGYANAADGAKSSQAINVLYSERLTQYCNADCAAVGAYCQLEDRGIPLTVVRNGPIAPCSKCGKPMDLRQLHVAYEVMDLTEIRQPWLLSAEPHDSETVARVCNQCDPDLSVGESLNAVQELAPLTTRVVDA